MSKKYPHNVSSFDFVIGFYCLIVDKNTSCLCSLLNFISRRIFYAIHQVLIYTKGFLPFVGGKRKMLVETVFLKFCVVVLIVFHCLAQDQFLRFWEAPFRV